MPFAAETYRPRSFDIRKTQPFVPEQAPLLERRVPHVFESEKYTGAAAIDHHIKHFDQNWRQEGLPQDWYNVRSLKGKHVGFSMQSQMELLQDPTDKEGIANWTQKTKQDLLGFKLEYLTDHIVYPCKYERNVEDPTRLENRLYGNADIVETVSEKERNGAVVRGLKEMKSFFLSDDTPDGSIAVMTSPVGPSGLKTDDGKAISYPDSYFFIMQKQGETVNNYTLKTNFSIPECREAIFQLTGKNLPPTTPLEEYVETIAKIKPGDHDAVPGVSDIVGVLENIRPEYAFKPEGKNEKTRWSEVYSDILQGEQLYAFNEKTQNIIEEFEAYCLEGEHAKEDYQKAIAVTILRLSKVFFVDEQRPQQIITLHESEWTNMPRLPHINSFGDALGAAAERPGCAGGGSSSSTMVNSITPRNGKIDEDEYGGLTFQCPHCGSTNRRPVGELIENCTNENCGKSVRC